MVSWEASAKRGNQKTTEGCLLQLLRPKTCMYFLVVFGCLHLYIDVKHGSFCGVKPSLRIFGTKMHGFGASGGGSFSSNIFEIV